MPSLPVTVVLAFAAYRATRIVTTDTLFSVARNKLYGWAWEELPGQDPVPRAGWRTYAYELLTCPLCLGVWVSAGVLALWWHWTDARWVLALLAVAGGQALIASRSDA